MAWRPPQTISARAKEEADAILTSLMMAERHKQWGMVTSILTFIREAGGKFLYMGPGHYALKLPSEHIKDP